MSEVDKCLVLSTTRGLLWVWRWLNHTCDMWTNPDFMYVQPLGHESPVEAPQRKHLRQSAHSEIKILKHQYLSLDQVKEKEEVRCGGEHVRNGWFLYIDCGATIRLKAVRKGKAEPR